MTRQEKIAAIGNTPRPFLLDARYLASCDFPVDPEENGGPFAVVNVVGVLSDDQWIGDTGYSDIYDELCEAAADPNIQGILMYVNSPGGECDGCFELADYVAQVATQKPIVALCRAAYSAAYMLASQASRVIVSPVSGGVGSIGVYGVHFDLSGMLEQIGVRATIMSAGEGKTDGNEYEPLKPQAKKAMQADIDRLYGQFVARVARGRGMSTDGVIALTARPYNGAAEAISSGLADMSGDINLALATLTAQAEGRRQQVSAAPMAAANPAQAEITQGGTLTMQAATAAAPVSPDLAQAGPGYSDAEQIATLCELAGQPARTRAFLSSRTPAAEVSRILLAERATRSDEMITDTTPQQASVSKDADSAASFSFSRYVAAQYKEVK